MTFLKTAAAAIVIAGLSAFPAFAAEAVLMEQVGDSGIEQVAGTLEWRKTLDENGATGLSAIVTIDGAHLAAEVTMTKNNDASLPASHLFQATFAPTAEFEGKSVVQFAGVMMRQGDEMQGTPLPGASAAVVQNQFIFAPAGAAPSGVRLGGSKWMDLALVFETGRRALLALEIDDTARAALTEMAL